MCVPPEDDQEMAPTSARALCLPKKAAVSLSLPGTQLRHEKRREKRNRGVSWGGRASGQQSQDAVYMLLASVGGHLKKNKKSKIGRSRELRKGTGGIIFPASCARAAPGASRDDRYPHHQAMGQTRGIRARAP